MKEYLEKSSKILDELQTTEQGLSEAEAARRLSEHGPNPVSYTHLTLPTILRV